MTPEPRNTIDDATHDEWVAATQPMKLQISKEWCEQAAKIEGDAAVGAGLPSALGLPKLAAPSGALDRATCSMSPELRRLVEAATDFVHNVERHHVAGWGDCGPSVDASFREMRLALRAVTENA